MPHAAFRDLNSNSRLAVKLETKTSTIWSYKTHAALNEELYKDECKEWKITVFKNQSCEKK